MQREASTEEEKMRTVFLALATSATIFVIGQTPVAAQEYQYCIQGDEFAGGAGECSFSTYAQCQASASGRMATCAPNRYLNAYAQLVDRSHPRRRSH
jgi:hypothetical protein